MERKQELKWDERNRVLSIRSNSFTLTASACNDGALYMVSIWDEDRADMVASLRRAADEMEAGK